MGQLISSIIHGDYTSPLNPMSKKELDDFQAHAIAARNKRPNAQRMLDYSENYTPDNEVSATKAALAFRLEEEPKKLYPRLAEKLNASTKARHASQGAAPSAPPQVFGSAENV